MTNIMVNQYIQEERARRASNCLPELLPELERLSEFEQLLGSAGRSSCTVTEVIDGDTFYCRFGITQTEKIRLIGVDAPELNTHEGQIAKNVTEYLTKGKTVTIETDVLKRDKYDRILAYVFLPDGKMLNVLLIQEGYATVSIYSPNDKYSQLLINAQ
jgi:micrococcal nuclease